MSEILLPLTVAAYVAALWLRRRISTPLLNPTLLAMTAIGALLVLTGTRYPSYAHATAPLSALLTPAVPVCPVSRSSTASPGQM